MDRTDRRGAQQRTRPGEGREPTRAERRHQGAAFIDVISPCVTFNNHAGSTKSYDYVRAHNEAVNRLDVIEGRAEIVVEIPAGETLAITGPWKDGLI